MHFFIIFLKQALVFDPEDSVLTVAHLIIGVVIELPLSFHEHLKIFLTCH